jgi:hypothetical protein
MDECSKRPNKMSMNKYEKSLGVFLNNNTKAYKTQTKVMKDKNKYNLWTKFLEKYKKQIVYWKVEENYILLNLQKDGLNKMKMEILFQKKKEVK